MIKLKSLLNESKNSWIEYDRLSSAEKESLYEYMVDSGGVNSDEYEDWIKKFVYKIQLVQPNQLIPILDKWGWDWRKENSDDERRISKISKIQKKTKNIWPYVVGNGDTLKKWATDEMNHGDGWHRLCVSLRKNEPINFLFIKIKS